jgi:hypothetical protein
MAIPGQSLALAPGTTCLKLEDFVNKLQRVTNVFRRIMQ